MDHHVSDSGEYAFPEFPSFYLFIAVRCDPLRSAVSVLLLLVDLHLTWSPPWESAFWWNFDGLSHRFVTPGMNFDPSDDADEGDQSEHRAAKTVLEQEQIGNLRWNCLLDFNTEIVTHTSRPITYSSDVHMHTCVSHGAREPPRILAVYSCGTWIIKATRTDHTRDILRLTSVKSLIG